MFKRRHPLSSKDIKQLLTRLQTLPWLNKSLSKEMRFELAELQSGEKIYVVNGFPLLIEIDANTMIPTLRAKDLLLNMTRVVVDMGAVPHIVNGADVMAPGIREIRGSCRIGDIVVVVDEVHDKEIAIGQTLKSAEEILQGDRKGKAFKNLHHVGDRMWKAIQQLSSP